MTFFYILNDPSEYVVYTHAKKNSELIHQLKCYVADKKTNIKLNLIYSSAEGIISFNNELVILNYSPINFEQALIKHNYDKDRLSNKIAYKEKFLNLYDKIALPFEKLKTLMKGCNINNIKQGIVVSKEETFKTYQLNNIDDFSLTIKDFINYVKSKLKFCLDFNFEDFFKIYNISTHHRLFDRESYETVVLENVYYRNKGFYDKNGNFFDITSINQDIEYQFYNKTKLKIDLDNAIQVNEPILFLDYIYDFYNFGEFWDILKRLVFFKQTEKVELYALTKNRILNIEQYFQKFNITYPPKYSRDYEHLDVISETDKGSTYFFKKLYFSTINNTCRSKVDTWSAFKINNAFNSSSINSTKYNLYLSRGKMKRGILKEEKLIEDLKNKFNFIVLNGDESLAEQQYYFTNANLILGAHGSLMCNTIWCKSNPIFVELAPATRCKQLSFFDDTLNCGFKSIIIPCEADSMERILLSDENIRDLCSIIEILK